MLGVSIYILMLRSLADYWKFLLKNLMFINKILRLFSLKKLVNQSVDDATKVLYLDPKDWRNDRVRLLCSETRIIVRIISAIFSFQQ